MVKVSKYYIFAPANYISGGPEALHQLAYYMNSNGLAAYMVYYDGKGYCTQTPHQRYLQYSPRVIDIYDIEDKPANYAIAPENAPWCLNTIHKAHKCIWWLSVKYHEIQIADWKEKIVYFKRHLLKQSLYNARKVLYNPNKCVHLCASEYAYRYVKEHYTSGRIEHLIEPISNDFLKAGKYIEKCHRKDVVLYNPAKSSNRMSDLLKRSAFTYIPLCGLTPNELMTYYKSAKLYVDFGAFGGPERMPKEAVYFGCNILVANHGAAVNEYDVPIPASYKVNDDEPNEAVEHKISEMLRNYENQCPDFNLFRQKVADLEQTFIADIKRIFDR